MRTLAVAILGAAFVSVGVGVPAQAVPRDCSIYMGPSLQACLNEIPPEPTKVADASSKKPVCQQPWPGGVNKPCSDCTSAINNDNGLKPQVDFDCGAPGGTNQYGGKAHCAVAGVPTMQPDCFGDLQADGSVNATN